MTTQNIGKAELKRLVWDGYVRSLQILWWMRWGILGLVIVIIAYIIIKH